MFVFAHTINFDYVHFCRHLKIRLFVFAGTTKLGYVFCHMVSDRLLVGPHWLRLPIGYFYSLAFEQYKNAESDFETHF